jgi:lysophospholipase L1-like esterase
MPTLAERESAYIAGRRESATLAATGGAPTGNQSNGIVFATGSDEARTLADWMADGNASRGGAGLRSIAFLGDSISVGYSATSTTLAKIAFPAAILQISKQRFYWPESLDFGVNGNTTAQMLARVGSVVSARPDICVVHGGTNDLHGGVLPAVTIANLGAIYDALIAAGITVIAIPILGRTTPATTSTTRNYGQQVNDWIRRSQGENRRGLVVVDCGLVFDDPTSTSWAERTGYTGDGLHPSTLGSYYIAKKVVEALDVLYPSFNIPVTSPTDAYHATENPYGNRLLSGVGMFGGTGGTITTGDASGDVATGWTLTSSVLGGATCVASKVTLADGRTAQRIALSGNYTGNSRYVQLTCSASASGLVEGDVVETMVEAFVAASAASIKDILVRQLTTENVTNYVHFDGGGWTVDSLPPEAHNPVFRTPPRTLLAGPSVVTLQIFIEFVNVAAVSTAIAAEIDFCSACVRTVRP